MIFGVMEMKIELFVGKVFSVVVGLVCIGEDGEWEIRFYVFDVGFIIFSDFNILNLLIVRLFLVV